MSRQIIHVASVGLDEYEEHRCKFIAELLRQLIAKIVQMLISPWTVEPTSTEISRANLKIPAHIMHAKQPNAVFIRLNAILQLAPHMRAET